MIIISKERKIFKKDEPYTGPANPLATKQQAKVVVLNASLLRNVTNLNRMRA